MVGQSPFGRPQTLRQAKNAFRKSSVKPKLSAKELAVAERRATLEERAHRLREREAKKKANLKKKEEKKAKEMEALIKQGKPVPREGGIKIGPSQMDLGQFLPIMEKIECEDMDTKSCESEVQNHEKSGADCTPPNVDPTIEDQQIIDYQTISGLWKPLVPAYKTKKSTLDTFMKPLGPAAATNVSPYRYIKPPATVNATITSSNTPIKPSTTVHASKISSTTFKKPLATLTASKAKSHTFIKPLAPASATKIQHHDPEDFSELFVSNTQIQRELSPPIIKPVPTKLSPSVSTTIFSMPLSEDDTVSFLATLSSQDLEVSLTQKGPVLQSHQMERDNSGYATQPDFDDLSDYDLCALVEKVEEDDGDWVETAV